jgi:hypothetical protein
MKKSISELLTECSKLPSSKAKAEFLQQNDSLTMRVVLQYALDPRIVWNLPPGEPPYKPCEFLDQEARLFQEIRKLYLFIKDSGAPDLSALKRESLFIQFLEGIDPKDAKLMCSVKDKKLPYKGLTANLINTAFPGLILQKEEKKSEQTSA